MSYREPDPDAMSAQAKWDQDEIDAEKAFKKALHGHGHGDAPSDDTRLRGLRAISGGGLTLLFPVIGLVLGALGNPASNGAAWAKPFVGGFMGAVLGAIIAGVVAIVRSITGRRGR